MVQGCLAGLDCQTLCRSHVCCLCSCMMYKPSDITSSRPEWPSSPSCLVASSSAWPTVNRTPRSVRSLKTIWSVRRTHVAQSLWSQRAFTPFWAVCPAARNADVHCAFLALETCCTTETRQATKTRATGPARSASSHTCSLLLLALARRIFVFRAVAGAVLRRPPGLLPQGSTAGGIWSAGSIVRLLL